MVFQCINIRQVPREVLKTAAFGLGFQQLPRDLANVNAWKTMFDPYIVKFTRDSAFRSKGQGLHYLPWQHFTIIDWINDISIYRHVNITCSISYLYVLRLSTL